MVGCKPQAELDPRERKARRTCQAPASRRMRRAKPRRSFGPRAGQRRRFSPCSILSERSPFLQVSRRQHTARSCDVRWRVSRSVGPVRRPTRRDPPESHRGGSVPGTRATRTATLAPVLHTLLSKTADHRRGKPRSHTKGLTGHPWCRFCSPKTKS